MSSETLPSVVSLMRAELEAYGGLLAAFDRQQRHLLERELERVEDDAHDVADCVAEAQECRVKREDWVREFAAAHDQPDDTTLTRMLTIFPSDQRPLIEALIKEINHLIHRVRRRARQNHGLLSRNIELHSQVFERFNPMARPRTYAASGRVPGPAATAALRGSG